MYHSTIYPSPIGEITIACDENGEKLIGAWIERQQHHGGKISKELAPNNAIPLFVTVKDWLNRYFSGEKPSVAELPLAPIGSDFRQEVWNILCKIPYGEVITYREIAKKMAKIMNRESMSSQAVGGAVAHNPISIIIPCHRVVGSNGSLTGFSAGIQTKIKLLELEGVDMSAFFTPLK